MTKFYRNHELEAKIIARAWKDAEFKKQLLKNPREAFKEAGYDLPKDLNLKVIEDDSHTYTFSLPNCPVQDKNLSTEELVKIAGGGAPSTFTLGCTA